MTEDIMRELDRLHRYAADLQGLIADAQARSPQGAEGTDGTGAVRVVLGADGLPGSIRVASDWRQTLAPGAVGDAVVEAFRAAAAERMAAWMRSLGEGSWKSKVERLREGLDEQLPSTTLDAVPAASQRDSGNAPRSLETLTEHVLQAFDSAEEVAAGSAMTATGAGSSASGRVAIMLSKGGVASCTVDQRWACRQSGIALSDALGEALASARADLARAAEAPNPARCLDQLLDEALAILRDPRRLADS